MRTRRTRTQQRIPEDDPLLAELVADLRVLHQFTPPDDFQQPRAASATDSRPRIGRPVGFHYRTHPARNPRGLLARLSASAGILTVIGCALWALSLAGRSTALPHSSLGAPAPTSAIPRRARIVLTLDTYVQTRIVEPKLSYLVQHFGAKSGTIVVERPSDGAVIALAFLPSHDPRTWQQVAADHAFSTVPNPAGGTAAAPGAPIEALLAGIGFDTKSFTERTTIRDRGQLKTDGITVQNWCLNACAFGGRETVSAMLHWGSSIAATQFAQLIPQVQLYHYLDTFGFGQRQSAPGLPNTIAGTLIEPSIRVQGKLVPNTAWRPAYRDSTAFGGDGIATTAIQLANAYAVLANGGRLMQPHLVQSYVLDGRTTVIRPQVLQSVFQQSDTAARVTTVLVHAAAHGEACLALVPGYDVAAATGAAVSYNSQQTIASTVAYGPIGQADPAHRFVVLIELEQPTNPWGSETVAPAAGEILQQLFEHYGLPPDPKHSQPSQRCPGPTQ